MTAIVRFWQYSFKNINNVSKQGFPICFSSRKYSTVYKTLDSKKIDPFGWFLLVIPVSTFSLGVWQIQRKKWKEGLMADLQQKTSMDPIKLPADLQDLKHLEYQPVHVRGTFLHDRELYMGPRSLLVKGDASTKSSLVSEKASTNQGYLVITPMKLEGRDDIILINRGWVPTKYKNPQTRQTGQVSDVVDVVGIVRNNESRPNFAMKNKEGSNTYFYRDLNHMAAVTGASPIFLDATNDFDLPNGPLGGQTRISLRNEHLSYILTWFSLSGATSYLWFKNSLNKVCSNCCNFFKPIYSEDLNQFHH